MVSTMNTLSLDPTDPDIAEALADCVVGEQKTLTIVVTPTVSDESKFEATVDEVEYAESAADDSAEEAPVDSKKSKHAPAIALVISKEK